MLVWTEIANIYWTSKKKQDINWWTEWVCRPPAALVVYGLRNTRITPNQVTFASFVVALLAGVLFAVLPGHTWLVGAALILELAFILDCADGQLARLRQTPSLLGHLLDFMMDELKAMVLLVCLTIRLWYLGEHPYLDGEIYLLAGLAGLLVLSSGLILTSFIRRPEYNSAPPPTQDGQPVQIASGSTAQNLIGLVERAARTLVHYPAYIWLFCAINRIDLFFWTYSGVHLLYAGRTFFGVFLRLGRFAPHHPNQP